MFISPTEAVKMYDVSKPTLYKDMSDGKLSFKKDNRKRRKINVAELDRLYSKRDEEGRGLTSDSVKHNTSFTDANVKDKGLISEVKAIRDQIEQAKNREIELLGQQIEQLREQNENLNRHLDETREEHRIYVRLLEDKRDEKGSATEQWAQKLDAMERQLGLLEDQNQLLLAKEEERKKRDEVRRKRIAERRQQKEQEKKLKEEETGNQKQGFLERLFG